MGKGRGERREGKGRGERLPIKGRSLGPGRGPPSFAMVVLVCDEGRGGVRGSGKMRKEGRKGKRGQATHQRKEFRTWAGPTIICYGGSVGCACGGKGSGRVRRGK